jgi:predicted ATPase
VKQALAGYTLTTTVRETQSASLLRGTRDADGTRVVLKLLRAEHPTGAQVARLRHEHALLSSLELPRLVRTFGLVKHGRGEGLVLEDLGDRSVAMLFGDRRPSPAEFLDAAIGMADAVGALHDRAIIHKDIKPHHFLVSEAGLKIIDLGIATRLSSETQAATSANLLEGTLSYMSPEQTGRMNRSLDRRTDLYSLGVSFYQLLTGRLPFEASDPLELVHAHIARVPRPVHELAPEVPRSISDIILKLLAKAAEDRYQSAAGLKADLEECRARLSGRGSIDDFPLGRHDGSGELSIPEKLYGRATELATQRAAFEGARRGGCRLLLISGYSGVGKSALVNEIRKHLGKGGSFVAGKFDQLNRSVPFAALATASRGLIRSILAEPPHVLAQYAGRLREAVGRNGKLIAELAPEIELVIGAQTPVPTMGPTESQARFELVFRQFLQVFADEEHPLALFLDDLQWADAASLRLLRQLLAGGQCSHLLIIGAYRNNETAELHPLSLTLDELRKAAVPIDEIVLKPLDLEAVTALVADTLRLDAAEVAPLAATLLRKTNGNPFFLQQFMSALAEQQLLRFDAGARRWTWDDRIEAAMAADNVVDLLIARLRRLPPSARRVLTLGACVGQEFDLATLSLVWQGPIPDLTAGLWEALREGLVIPLDASYRYLAEAARASNDLGEAIHSRYRFLHDRVQQGAYELVDAEERSEIHLRIGRLLLGAPESEPSDESLFEVVRQMNLGQARIAAQEDRQRLARFNLRAGIRVAGSGAHGSALPLLRNCLALLGASPWEADHQTAHRAHLALAECEFMSTNTAGALQVLDAVEAHSRTVLERVAGREIRIAILASAVSGMLDAVACGVETARMLGAEFPADDAGIGAAIGAELGALKGLLANRTVESLLDLPEVADPEKRALVDVLFKTNAPAFMSKPDVSVLIGLKAVRLAIEHGNAPMSPYFYDNYGIINNATGGELDVSFRFGQLGIDLLQKPGYAEIAASTHFLFGAFNSHWRRPISVSQEHLRQSVKLGLESGAYLHVAWAALIGMYYRLYRGEPIPEILADMPKSMDLLRRSENPAAQTLLKVLDQTLKAFSGMTADPTSLDGEGFQEAGFLEAAKKIRVLWVYYHVLKLPLVFHAGDYRRALELAEAALPLMPGMFFITEHALYRSLARAALAAEATGEARDAAIA